LGGFCPLGTASLCYHIEATEMGSLHRFNLVSFRKKYLKGNIINAELISVELILIIIY